VTETSKMSTENSANKLWRGRDVVTLLPTTAIAGPMILRGEKVNHEESLWHANLTH
jgi:hypothetical protein